MLGLFGTNLFQITDCVSVPTFCEFVDHLRWLLENSSFKNLWRINCLGWKFVQCGRIHFTLTKFLNKLISRKSRVFISLVGPSETGKSQLIYNWLKLGIFQPKFDKIYFFHQHSQPLYNVMQKEIENLEFVQGVNFEFIDSLKKRHKILVNIWRLLWGDLQFKSLCWHCHRWETSGSEHNLH